MPSPVSDDLAFIREAAVDAYRRLPDGAPDAVRECLELVVHVMAWGEGVLSASVEKEPAQAS